MLRILLLIIMSAFTFYIVKKAYQVQKGNTLWGIAQTHGTTVDNLLANNPGVDPKRLQIGQTLNLGTQPTQTAAPTAQTTSATVPTSSLNQQPVAQPQNNTQRIPQSLLDVYMPHLWEQENAAKKGWDPVTKTWSVYEDLGQESPYGGRGAVGPAIRVNKPVGYKYTEEELNSLLNSSLNDHYSRALQRYPQMSELDDELQAILLDATWLGPKAEKAYNAFLKKDWDRAAKEMDFSYKQNGETKLLERRNNALRELIWRVRNRQY